MKLADFFKIVEDKHLPEDVIEFRDIRTDKLIGRTINVSSPKKKRWWKLGRVK